jgi:hypothetical protein
MSFSSNAAFQRRLGAIVPIAGLDPDDTPMTDVLKPVMTSPLVAAEPALAQAVNRYEKLRPIPKLSEQLAKSNLQSPLFKAGYPLLYQSAFLDLKSLAVLTSTCRRATPFFSPPIHMAQAERAAHLLLCRDIEGVEKLVKQNPNILYLTVEAKDHRGRRVRGTLLQLAILAGDVNIRPKKNNAKDHGAVERLKAYLPELESVRQLQATQVNGWEQETAARMQVYMDALKTFLNAICTGKASTFDGLIVELEDSIKAFKSAFTPHPDAVITTGFIFDTQIFLSANLAADRLNGCLSAKSEVFDVIGFGTLQANASACDIQILITGIHSVMLRHQDPDYRLNSVDIPSSLSGLGVSFVLGLNGIWMVGSGTTWAQMAGYGQGGAGENGRKGYTRLHSSKNSSVADCYAALQQSRQEPSNHAKSQCIIM